MLLLFISTLINFVFWALIKPDLFFDFGAVAGFAVIPLSGVVITVILDQLFKNYYEGNRWIWAYAFSINLLAFIVAMVFFQEIFYGLWKWKQG